MKQWLSKYQHFYIYDALAALLVFFVPFSYAFPNLILIPLGLVFLFNKKWKIIKLKDLKKLAFFLIAILFITINIGIKGNFNESFDIVSKLYITIAFFLLFYVVIQKTWVEIAFLSGLMISFFISVYNITSYFIQNDFINIDIGPQTNALLSIERPYLGFMMALGIFILFKNIRNKIWSKWFYILSLVFIAFVVYISARLSLGLILIIVLQHLNVLYKKRRMLLYGSVFAFATIFVFAIIFNDNFRNRMRIKSNYHQTIKALKAYETRYLIWPCAIENTAKTSWFFGTGGYNLSEKLQVECYTENINRSKKKRYYQTEAFNTHNQYLDFLLVSGLIPFVCLVVFLLSLCLKYYKQPLGILSLIFILFFLVENVLHRQLGVFLFGIFLGLFWSVLTIKSEGKNL